MTNPYSNLMYIFNTMNINQTIKVIDPLISQQHYRQSLQLKKELHQKDPAPAEQYNNLAVHPSEPAQDFALKHFHILLLPEMRRIFCRLPEHESSDLRKGAEEHMFFHYVLLCSDALYDFPLCSIICYYTMFYCMMFYLFLSLSINLCQFM